MVDKKFSLALVLLLLAIDGESARILALFPYPAKSHYNCFATLLDELAIRGHQMTVVSAFPRKSPLANYTDIAIDDYYGASHQTTTGGINWFETGQKVPALILLTVWQFALKNCERFLNYPQIQALINGQEEFDIIIYEPFFAECSYGFIHKYKKPFVQISSLPISPWMGEGVGNPNFFSYIPDVAYSFSDHMSFKERFINSLHQTFIGLARDWYVLPKMEALMRTHFTEPSLPSIQEIETNASFLLLNTHEIFHSPRPLTPNTAQVGGMHIKKPKKLPQDLQKYLDDAPHGVIFFSLGSIVRGSSMPESARNAFLEAFSQLKQKVLWKWEDTSLPGKPGNVRIEKWLPQNDILAHPNVKAFMTHGGLLSTQEATYHGVPLIAVPVMFDQYVNALRAQRAGYAVLLDIHALSAEKALAAINEVLHTPSYAENAKRLSRVFRDQPETPLARAVFWIEYVLRHNGAPHVKSAALRLNFFQYYILDVIAVVLLSIVSLSVMFFLLIKSVCRCLPSRSSVPKRTSRARKDE